MSAKPTLRNAILDLLREGPLTMPELASLLQRNLKTIDGCIRQTRKLQPDAMHIIDYRRHTGAVDKGLPSPVFAIGPGRDKQRPKPMSRSEVNRRYEANHSAVRRAKRRLKSETNRVPVWLQGLMPVASRQAG